MVCQLMVSNLPLLKAHVTPFGSVCDTHMRVIMETETWFTALQLHLLYTVVNIKMLRKCHGICRTQALGPEVDQRWLVYVCVFTGIQCNNYCKSSYVLSCKVWVRCDTWPFSTLLKQCLKIVWVHYIWKQYKDAVVLFFFLHCRHSHLTIMRI